MKADRTTKVLLLVIAVALWSNLLWRPKSVAAQDPTVGLIQNDVHDIKEMVKDIRNVSVCTYSVNGTAGVDKGCMLMRNQGASK
jgi:hypothetical protein